MIKTMKKSDHVGRVQLSPAEGMDYSHLHVGRRIKIKVTRLVNRKAAGSPQWSAWLCNGHYMGSEILQTVD